MSLDQYPKYTFTNATIHTKNVLWPSEVYLGDTKPAYK
jgi:hypothetical protein